MDELHIRLNVIKLKKYSLNNENAEKWVYDAKGCLLNSYLQTKAILVLLLYKETNQKHFLSCYRTRSKKAHPKKVCIMHRTKNQTVVENDAT